MMLKLNADTHLIFRRMHNLSPKLPPEVQDKRMAAILEMGADRRRHGEPRK